MGWVIFVSEFHAPKYSEGVGTINSELIFFFFLSFETVKEPEAETKQEKMQQTLKTIGFHYPRWGRL